jgi:hypothetical protein
MYEQNPDHLSTTHASGTAVLLRVSITSDNGRRCLVGLVVVVGSRTVIVFADTRIAIGIADSSHLTLRVLMHDSRI